MIRLASIFEKTTLETDEKKISKSSPDVIVLDTDESDASIVEITDQSLSTQAIISSLEKLAIKPLNSARNLENLQPVKEEEELENSFLPLSMRMKKICQKTSIMS